MSLTINVVGGGPGGLYASLLLKKANPDYDITVYERDPADNTYGWGVVFSDATLSSLREADYETHEAITDAFVHWNPIDIYYKGTHHRCGGHSFAGIMRADLLEILQDRCAELDVEMHHEHNIEDPDHLRDDADLVIGADGLKSVTRERYEESFRPKISEGSAKFAWFGTEKPFDVFTFIFRENEHGLWQIHAYPGPKSTFIVECQEDTWRAAGMDEKSEAEALSYFEDLFSDHLGDYELLSKLYAWRNFPVVRNRSWNHEQEVILLGDAAHTAHFSIGSGTKLAMEDSIALYEAFEEKGEDVPAALDWYEKERRPRVNALQEAAKRSRRYFEHVPRYLHMDPYQFSVHLLTRSGRISYDNLRIRDPEFVDAYDRWFAAKAGEAETPPAIATPPLFKPLELREVRLPNRVVLTPDLDDAASDGRPSAGHLDAVVDLGTTDAGFVLTDPVAVSAQGRVTPGTAGLYADDHADAWGEAIDRIRDRSDTRVGAHLLHAGRRGATRPRSTGLDRPLPSTDAWELLAPSAKPYTSANQRPKRMDDEDLAAVREEFVMAAEHAEAAGFDHLQLHWGHGYLLSSFLSPLTNDRDDEYGGSLDDRLRYPMAVMESVREAWPADKPLGITLQATDWNSNGFTLAQSTETARRLAETGCDLLAVVAGQTSMRQRPDYSETALPDYTDRLRNESELPALTTHNATTTDEINTLIGSGRADLCTFHPSAFE